MTQATKYENDLIEIIALNWYITKRAARDYFYMFNKNKTKQGDFMKNRIKNENFIESCAALLNDTFEESREEYRTRMRIFQKQKVK